MANDYTIYLKSKAIETTSSHTQPFSNRSDEDESVAPFVAQSIGKAQDFATGQANFGSLAQAGVSALSKVAPWIAVAVAVAKVTDKVISTTFTQLSTYTGNYAPELQYNNFKNVLGDILNPVGMSINMYKLFAQREKQNIEIEQRRLLVGSTTNANLVNRGV